MSHRLLILAIFALSGCNIAMAESADVVETIEALLPPHAGACVMAIDGDRVIFEHAYGVADIESGARCTPATNFRMASVSKQFTATAVMLLVDRGELSLGDTLDKFFPGFPRYGRGITVEQLLVHTSGLPAYEARIPAGTTLQLNDVDVLHILMDTSEPRFAPGSKWEYSNSGYTLLGLIVEVVANQPFHEFMCREVLKPLGMNHSVLYQRGLNEAPRRAFGHTRKGEAWIRADQSVTSATRGDGAIYTSLRDYRKWLEGIKKQKLLKPKSYEAMFTPHVATDRGSSHYGYGWFIDKYRDETRIHHNGDTSGFRLCVQWFPEREAAILIQLNNNIEGEPEEMMQVGERVADALIFDQNR